MQRAKNERAIAAAQVGKRRCQSTCCCMVPVLGEEMKTLGLGRKKIASLIKDEHKAVAEYSNGIASYEDKEDTSSAKVLKHIRGEEKEHARILKKLK